MARKTSRQTSRQVRTATRLEEPVRHPFRWDWLLSLLLLISVSPDGPFQTVRIIPAVTNTVLAPEWAWDPPAARVSAVQAVAEWPYWLYTVAMSFLIASVLTQRAETADYKVRLAILMALSLLSQPANFLAAAIVITALKVSSPALSGDISRRTIASMGTVVIAAFLLCLDFSIVLLALTACWLPAADRCQARGQIAGAMVLLTPLGFSEAFARPLTWLTVPENVLPVTPGVGDDSAGILLLILAAAVVSHSWWIVWISDRQRPAQLLLLAVFSLLSLTCRYYQFVSLLSVVCLTEYAAVQGQSLLGERRLRWSVTLVAMLLLWPQIASYQTFVLTGRWPRQFVDPSTWETSGRVMLMQPQHSSRWQTGRTGETFNLIIDDRWDLFRDQYRNYQQVCHDLSEVRSSRYLRSDGQWGGYKQWTEQWKPTLLVVDSSDLDGIRRLSLSPHWKVMGIDSHRTIFGAEDDAKNAKQSRTAALLLAELEWPSPQFDGSFGNVLAATGDVQRLKVARVLLSMRLPYSALRVMPERSASDDMLSAMCHFEMAHRVFRHTRTHTLLDQYRAVYHLQKLVENDQLSAKQLLRVARGLEELDEPETATEFATQLTDPSGSNTTPEQQWAAELVSRCRSRNAEEPPAVSDNPEVLIRQAMRSGDSTAVASHLGRLKGSQHDFFHILADSTTKSSEDVYRELIGLVNRPDFPNQLRGEALFYLGSLAIEIGDSPGAASAFSASIQAAPAQPLNSISRVSLMNLQKPGR